MDRTQNRQTLAIDVRFVDSLPVWNRLLSYVPNVLFRLTKSNFVQRDVDSATIVALAIGIVR